MFGVWRLTRPPTASVETPPTARLQPTPQPQLPATPPPATPTPKPVTTPAPVATPTPAPAPSIITALALSSNVLRDGGETPRVALPRGKNSILRLKLELDMPWPSPYRAELLTAEGQNIATQRGKGLVYNFPARLLPPGDYQLKLNRINENRREESAGRFYFRVTQ